jgi:hypothetical protein
VGSLLEFLAGLTLSLKPRTRKGLVLMFVGLWLALGVLLLFVWLFDRS